MKKILTLLSVLVLVLLNSCSSHVCKAGEVALKVKGSQELTQEDYMVIVDNFTLLVDDAAKIQEKLGPLTAANRAQYKEAAKELQERYPHAAVLGPELLANPVAKNLNEADAQRTKELLNRMFTVPAVLLSAN